MPPLMFQQPDAKEIDILKQILLLSPLHKQAPVPL